MEPIKNITSTDTVMESNVKTTLKPEVVRTQARMVADSRSTGTGFNKANKESSGKEPVDFPKLTDTLNRYVRSKGIKISFKYDERVSRPVIVVRDQETGEVIRQIPQEEMLELVDKLNDINGMLFRGRG
ncbi:MAG: flagellar protein FlaG [Candidatus Marinimicrobia bacterium]|nr:flagellar protein FlaG [Candidatus Neomarinimicrobiota bacterium]MCF7841112.1 flagellar protein FlaG [Candidatus Neomarinimicrobiota bacterium]MCF7901798.1 flagellar protein FlaG [Candidatus Neomarinimicrobiota bacterium]